MKSPKDIADRGVINVLGVFPIHGRLAPQIVTPFHARTIPMSRAPFQRRDAAAPRLRRSRDRRSWCSRTSCLSWGGCAEVANNIEDRMTGG